MRRSDPFAGASAWRALIVVLLFVLVPTMVLAWFLQQALDIERLAVREELRNVEQARLGTIADALASRWTDAAIRRERVAGGTKTRAAAFAELVAEPGVRTVLLPAADDAWPMEFAAGVDDLELLRARGLEATAEAPAHEVTAAWRAAVEAARSPRCRALALLGEARALRRSGDGSGALAVLDALAGDPTLAGVRGPVGELLVPGALLLAVETADGAATAGRRRALMRWIRGDGATEIPLVQRLVLARGLESVTRERVEFPMRDALELAEVLEGRARATGAGLHVMPSVTEDGSGPEAGERVSRACVLARATAGSVVAVLDRATIESQVADLVATSPGRCGVALVAPEERRDDIFALAELGDPFTGWRLVADAPANSMETTNLWWVATLAVVTIVLCGALGAAYVSRQLRVARLGTDLVQNVSHEFRTPLAAIRALTETLRTSELDDGRRAEYLALIEQENDRLTHLVQSFLTFARIERGRGLFASGRIDVGDLVDHAAGVLRHRFEGCEERLEVEIADDLPEIVGDEAALTTALTNLIDNAHRYSGPRRRVVVRARRIDGGVEIAVEDDGIGMTEREARRCFDRYYRANDRLDAAEPGCGLGLSLVRAVVEAHGGAVRVASAPGRGSTFSIVLPAGGRD